MGDYSQNLKIDNIEKLLSQLMLKNESSNAPIDLEQITEKISKKVIQNIGETLNKNSPLMYNKSSIEVDAEIDTFDNVNTLEKLAKSMSMQKVNAVSNFENIGEVKTSVKDEKEHQNTIDLLKNIDD